MTKAEKFRKASKVVWLLGAFFTWSFVRSVLTGTIAEPAVLWGVSLGAALGLQYILTLIEGTIIEGKLPPPWSLDFKDNMTLSILAVAAYGCFLFDIMLNLGGVYTFTSKIGNAVGEVKQLGISDYIIQVVGFIATFFFAMLFALGSELLDQLAEMYESGRSMSELRKPKTDPALLQRDRAARVQAAAAEQQAANQRTRDLVTKANRSPARIATTEMTDADVLAALQEKRNSNGGR